MTVAYAVVEPTVYLSRSMMRAPVVGEKVWICANDTPTYHHHAFALLP